MSLSDKKDFHHTLGATRGPWDDIEAGYVVVARVHTHTHTHTHTLLSP